MDVPHVVCCMLCASGRLAVCAASSTIRGASASFEPTATSRTRGFIRSPAARKSVPTRVPIIALRVPIIALRVPIIALPHANPYPFAVQAAAIALHALPGQHSREPQVPHGGVGGDDRSVAAIAHHERRQLWLVRPHEPSGAAACVVASARPGVVVSAWSACCTPRRTSGRLAPATRS